MKLITSLITIIVILSLFNLASCKNSQVENLRDKIKMEAETMSKLLVNKDYKNFVKYIYPHLLEVMGGKEKVINIFNQGLPNGNTIKSVKVSYPSDTIMINNQIQCTVNEEITMNVKGGKLIVTSTLIGLSNDQGKTWYFLDANSKSQGMLKRGFPELSNRLIIVESSKPIFISE